MDLQQKIAKAKAAGYSEAEIQQFLGQRKAGPVPAIQQTPTKPSLPANTPPTQSNPDEFAPANMVQQISPSKMLPAAGLVAQSVAEGTGLDLANPVNPVHAGNIGQVVKAAQNPVQVAKTIGTGVRRGFESLTDSAFKPTDKEKVAVHGGKLAGMALELMAPATKLAKGGSASRAAETLDSLAGVPRGSSFALLSSPSKWTKIFASNAKVKDAYKKAVDAGESIVEDIQGKSFDELVDQATTGTTKTIKDLAVEVAPQLSGDAAKVPVQLTTFRKAVNDEIGRLKKIVEHGLISAKSNNLALRRLLSYEEMARRTNKVLDVVAPKFREADKLKAAQMQMKPFRQGFKALTMGTGIAAAGAATQQGYRAGNALSMVEEGLNRLTAKKEKRRGK
jgi:hypothetical protein